MSKILPTLASSLLICLIFACPVLAPLNTELFVSDSHNKILQDIIADFGVYNSLINDVYTVNQYRISLHANNPDDASDYLAKVFDPALADAMTHYYLQWLPELRKMAVIPIESIPIISEADKPYLSIVRISPKKAVLKRTYTDCYEKGDKYVYLITTELKGQQWIIVDLRLDCLLTDSESPPDATIK
ncbi:MAG: hypothetical protein PHF24_04340 [Syntrophomonas sp.]|nr:hypothetical protein [Syntrophomonas sp.]